MGVATRLARSTPFGVRLALFAALALVLVWTSLGHAASANEFRDAQVMLAYERAAVDTVRHFGQVPLWDPYYCGGLDGVGAPQSRFASPTLLLSVLFGAERADLLIVFLFVVAGMEGMFRWLRLRVTSAPAALVVAPVFALSGHFAVAYFRGWTNFFGFELVPWILLGITLAARGKLRGIAIAAIAFAVMLGFGGSFAAPLVAVAALVEALRAVLDEPHAARARALAMLAATASFMATVACVRLWPIAETLAAAPRLMAGTPGHQPRALLAAVTSLLVPKDGDILLSGSFFVGSAFLAVAALGAADRRALRGLVAVVVFVWLSAGYARKPALFALLRELPVFNALRYPERFLWLAILFASEPAALAIGRIPLIGEGRRWRVGVWIVLAGGIGFTIFNEISAFHRTAQERALGTLTASFSPDFHQTRGNRWLVAHYQAMGVGSLSCWETHPVMQSTLLRADLPAEEYLSEESRDAGAVTRVSWSPNEIVLRANLTRPARILVNQNWHPGWHASVGAVVSAEGLIAIDVPQGEQEVRLRFRPWSTLAGAGVTGSALLALGALGWLTRRRGALFSPRARKVTIALVALPWVVAGSAYALSPDPHFPPPTMRNANGAPALVDVADEKQLPGLPLGAEMSVPIRVEAGSVKGPDELQDLVLDVYLRRTGALARATTMFVHLERRTAPGEVLPKKKDGFYNADHQVIAGSFYLSDSPEGRVVHDVRGVHLKEAAPGTWDVYVAFGHVSGQQGRAKVVNPGTATVDTDRVKIGTFVVE